MARKSKPLNNPIGEEHPWLTLLKENQSIQSYINQLHIWISKFEPVVSLEQQLQDIQQNRKISAEYPMVSVQIGRLRKHLHALLDQSNISENDFDQAFKVFHDSITDQITLSDASRQWIDPNCKSIRDFSSKITAYKQWLEKVMFLVLCFSAENTTLEKTTLKAFLASLNGVISASTISRIRLRSQPKIDSVSFAEIPRNTPIKILGAPIDQHWVKVSVVLDDIETEGYLQLAYILK